ncbi:Protein of unknown function D [Prunus dulcis]|uniref:Uncharacterized protein n=1 Tax=Prunus dulcis TaxID=3755 RepID=A0A4Y1S1G4_PRUDU|nr:Protein of unknown function D [Prunus dulcis]
MSKGDKQSRSYMESGVSSFHYQPYTQGYCMECNLSADGEVPESSPSWCHAPFDPEDRCLRVQVHYICVGVDGIHSLSIFVLVTSNLAIIAIQGLYWSDPENNLITLGKRFTIVTTTTLIADSVAVYLATKIGSTTKERTITLYPILLLINQ